MKIVESILTENRCYTVGMKINPKGLMLHSVGCPQPDASVFVRTWNTPQISTCVHAFIDGNTGEIYQTLPWDRRGWHAGDSANDTHIGVEMCEPADIEYTSGANFTCFNLPSASATAKRTYEAAVELFAHLCKEFNLDPLADGVIISHSEGAKRGVASGHADPEHLWNGLGTDYTMDGFRKAVKAAMTGEAVKDDTTAEKVLYRVQAGAFKEKANAEAYRNKLKAAGFGVYMILTDGLYKIQIGAYSVKANAEDQLAKVKAAGFDAFITTKGGKAVAETKKTVEEVAVECIRGDWGNGADRERRLTAAGYDYNEVQEKINELWE